MEKKKVVIALGGNALGKDIEEQKEAVAKTAEVIVDLAEQGLDIIVTHGNGPQVGMIQNAMDNLIVMQKNYKQVPLPTSVAMSQGYIGIDLQNAIKYELLSRNIDGKVSTILSQVEVDKDDPAFENPTKPIGRFLTKEEADENEKNGIRCMEDAGRGYRIVVASPMPKRIRELQTIKTLVDAGHIVITCGGGGIPVVSDEDGRLVGVNAVIDKDNASSLLASQLGADHLVILTAVEKVAINWGKENQEWLSDLTIEQAKEYIAQEQFAKGSMLPKVEAAIRFAESKEGRRALITLLDKAAAGIAGETGTVIHS
ncbi:carbamate kinase [Lachnospiraceae bacterium 42-17]|jgi:carbamate kinase|uniref:carbamate kinase n=1 Tax=Sporofaciens musculi TaxID=2681861 RepID=UPI00216B916D|nr:carbamate kinase [Sporofaciens musculi]MCI9216086.1 carbamate kinase [Dorea sp.]